MSRRLDDVRLAVVMLDGMEVAERTHVVALGITTAGVKVPLGLWEGSTENATLARKFHDDPDILHSSVDVIRTYRAALARGPDGLLGRARSDSRHESAPVGYSPHEPS